MEKFSNKEVAKLLRNMAAAYILLNENQFKILAYQKAADAVEGLSREIRDIWQEGKLDEVPSLGKSLTSHLDELLRTGHSKHFDSILKKIPATVFMLMDIPGIGPKKAYKLVKILHLRNERTLIDDLKKAIQNNKIAEIENFGQKSQEEIGRSIGIFEKRASKQERMPLPYAFTTASEVISYLKKNPKIKRVDALGSLRRMQSTIGDIDISIQLKSQISNVKSASKEVINYFIHYPKTIRVENAGQNKASIIISPYIRIDLRVQGEKSYGAMLQYFTGNKAHNIRLREYALKKGYSLSEYGIKKLKTIYEFSNETDFYKFLGLQYIPPELREGTDEIEIARSGKIPKLVELKDIKGDLHLHSSFAIKPSHDLGADDFGKILDKGRELGYEYVGFSEHNPKSSLSDGEINRIMKKRKEILKQVQDDRNREINYFIGLEVDILPNGQLALPQEALKYVDYLIVAVHSVFNMGIPQMTKRVLEATKSAKVKILGHPTGRMLGTREGFELEWEKIFEMCKKNNIALEINAWPERLDLPDILVREAIKNGVKLIINTDAHAVDQMSLMFYGVSVARRGWAKKNDIINTLSYKEFSQWLLK